MLLLPTYRHGTWASHLIAATTDMVVVPDDIDTVQLAMVGINPITALLTAAQLWRSIDGRSVDRPDDGQLCGRGVPDQIGAAVRLENPEAWSAARPPPSRSAAGVGIGS